MGEPGGLPSMGSHRVGHDWRDLAAAAAAFIRIRTQLVRSLSEFPQAVAREKSLFGSLMEKRRIHVLFRQQRHACRFL